MSETTSKSPKRNKKIFPKGDQARENFLINLAFEEAVRRLTNGTASSQIITTLLNMASSKTKLELEKLKSDLKVAEAKIETMAKQQTSADIYEEALAAFKSYSGQQEEEDYDNEEYD